MNGARTLAFGLSRRAVATLQNFRTCGCSRSLARQTNPLGRQALELHTMGRWTAAGPPSPTGWTVGYPGTCTKPRLLLPLRSTRFLSQLLSAQKKFSRRPWIDLLSFPIIHIPQGSLTTFAVPKQPQTLSPTDTKGTLCRPESLAATLSSFSWPPIVRCTPLPQDSLRRRVILSSHRPPAYTPSVQSPQH